MNRERLFKRASAALIAAAAGDALGWPQEPRGGLIGGRAARSAREPRPTFDDWQRKGGNRFLSYVEPVAAGSYSDDTQLLLAVARSCLSPGDWRHHLTEIELPAWPVYQRGGGRAVLRAANVWAKHTAPWLPGRSNPARNVHEYHQAGANGVAMRIAPHVIWAIAADAPRDEMLRRIVLDGITTHGHPRALIGALAYASSLAFALTATETLTADDLVRGAFDGLIGSQTVIPWLPEGFFAGIEQAQFASSWQRTLNEMDDLLSIVDHSLNRGSLSRVTETLKNLGALDKASNGSGTVSAAAAIFLAARSGTRPSSGLVQAAFEPDADTDTIASMTGALLGAVHGDSWLGALATVQDATYIERLAHALASRTPTHSLLVAAPSATALQRHLEASDVSDGAFVDGRQFHVQHRQFISNGPIWVLRVNLDLVDGQTMVVDYAHRNPPTGLESPGMASAFVDDASQRATVAPPDVVHDRPLAGRAVFARVSLGTRKLADLRQFYEAILGNLPLAPGGVLRLTDSVEFEERHDATLGINVHLVVSRLEAVTSHLSKTMRVDFDGEVAILRDPEGRLVHISEIRNDQNEDRAI